LRTILNLHKDKANVLTKRANCKSYVCYSIFFWKSVLHYK